VKPLQRHRPGSSAPADSGISLLSSQKGPLRICVVDGQPLFRKGLVDTIRSLGRIIVDEGETPDDVCRLVQEAPPDILIVDITIAGGIIAAVEEAARLQTDMKIVILTASEREQHVSEALRAGAMGYILKSVTAHDLVKALEGIHRGEPYIMPSLASRLLARSKGQSLFADKASSIGLTNRDKVILHHLVNGLNNSEMASELGITVRTIKYRLSAIFKKMRVRDRVQAVLQARDMGINRSYARGGLDDSTEEHD